MMNRLALIGLGLPVLAFLGCSPPPCAEVRLHQPVMEGPQRNLSLVSDWSFAESDAEATRLLLECPLPGSRRGHKQFAIYLRLPSAPGAYAIGHRFGDNQVVSGFLIQRTGWLRGMTPVVAGEVFLDQASPWCGRMWVACADATEIQGRFTSVGGGDLLSFEAEHVADIALAARRAGESEVQLAGEPHGGLP